MIDRQSALLHCAKGGQIMKKLALALLVVAFAASPAAAASKKKAKPYGMTYEQAMKANQESWGIVKQGLPLVLPSWAIPIYFGTHMDEEKEIARRGGARLASQRPSARSASL
jgi:hypothetical protein